MIKKIATNTVAQALSKASTAIISIFLIKVLTNYLDIEWYWLYSKIYNYLWIFAFLADLWLYTIWIREISKNRDNAEKIAGNILTLRTISAVLIMLVAFVIALFLPWYNSFLALASIWIVWLFTIFSLINSTILSCMHAFLKSEKSLISVFTWKLVNIWIILWVVFIFMPKGTEYSFETSFLLIMSSWLIWVIIMTLLNYYYSRDVIKIKFRFDIDYIKHIFLISLPYWLALFLSTLYTKIDLVLLSILEWENKWNISVALYNVPLKIADVAMFFWVMFLSSMLPFLTKTVKNQDKKELNFIVSESFKILTSIWLLFISLWVLFRDNVISTIANADYINHNIYQYTSSDAMAIVLFVLLFYFLSQLFIYILIATDKQSYLLKVNLLITFVNIVWNLIFIPKYSFVWAAFVTVFSQALLWLIIYFKVKSYIWRFVNFRFLFLWVLFSFSIYWIWSFIITSYWFWWFKDILFYWFPLVIIYVYVFYITFFRNSITRLKTLKM